MKKLLFFAFAIMTMAATAQNQKDLTKSDPSGKDRYDLVVGTKAPLSIFEIPAYDYSANFFDGFGKKTAAELGIAGKKAWDEFGATAKLIIVDKDAIIWFENGSQWTECYLEGCTKNGKPYFNRLQVIGRKIIETVPGETTTIAGKDGANGIHCWDLNMNGVNDPNEDVNHDGYFDVRDCQGPVGPQGPSGPQGPAGANGASTNCNCGTTPTYVYGSGQSYSYGYGYSQPVGVGYGYGYSQPVSYGYVPQRSVEVNVGLSLSFSKGSSQVTNNNTNNTWINTGSKPDPKPTNPRGTIITQSGGCPAGTFLFNGKCLTPGQGNGNQPGSGTTAGTGNGNEPGGDQTPKGPGQGNGNEPGGRYGKTATTSKPVVKNNPTPTTYYYKAPNLEQKGYYYGNSGSSKSVAPAKTSTSKGIGQRGYVKY